MRRGRGGGGGGGRSFIGVVALCATVACGGGRRVQPKPVAVTACALIDTLSIAADTATITFRALGMTREQCALMIVASTLRPWPAASSGLWTVRLSVTPTAAIVRRLDGEDARNAIDAGSALIATDDLELTAYAATHADLEVTPLPWDRTYVLLSPSASRALGSEAGPDAVRADARSADPPACEPFLPETSADSGTHSSKRVVHDAADRTGRELAERIVALAERSDATAVGLSDPELDVALHAGNELAFIVSIARGSYCASLAALARQAPWVTPGSVQPLIDTRAHAIASRPPRP